MAEAKPAGDDAYSAKKAKGAVFKRRKNKKKKAGGTSTGQTAAQLRIQRDLGDLDLTSNTNVQLVRQPNDWMNFALVLTIDRGYWKGAKYKFTFKIPPKYPFAGPKVICSPKIYHPNIDLEGKVCVNVLRPWKPTYSTQIVLFGLMFLFESPNPDDPLNKVAAGVLREDTSKFARNVKTSLRGGSVNGEHFTKMPNYTGL